MIENRKQIQENELLDFHHSKLNNDTLKEKKHRKQVLQRIIKPKQRNHSFQYMTKFLSKGIRGSLRKVHIINETNEIIKTLISRKEIEDEIINYNRNHLKQAHHTKIYQDRIYKKLQKNEIRDKILSGTLSYEEYDDENVF